MIPKIIHQIWLGDQSNRPDSLMDTWRQKNPSCGYILWTEDNLPTLENQRAFDLAPSLPAKADILRYEILLKYGGVYFDADSECLEELDDHIFNREAYITNESEVYRPGLLANGMMGSVAGGEYVKDLVQGVKDLPDSEILKADGVTAWRIVGPEFATRIYNEKDRSEVYIMPSHTFLPVHYSAPHERYRGPGKVYSDHRWGSTPQAEYEYGSDKKVRILMTLLTSNDIPKLRRLVKSALEQEYDRGIEFKPVIVVNSKISGYYERVLAENFPLEVYHTESNGLPGKGKNSCHKIFLDSGFDFLSQIDGDDILYPTCVQSLSNHIRQYPCLDVLGVIPSDIMDTSQWSGHSVDFGNGMYAGVWGASLVAVSPEKWGPAESPLFRNDNAWSENFMILQSRKSAKHLMKEDLPIFEDMLFGLQMLGEHQRGRLVYHLTMSSDFFCIDRSTEGSIQKKHNHLECLEIVREEALKHVPRWRSSSYELPVMYKPLLLSQEQKADYLKKVVSENPEACTLP